MLTPFAGWIHDTRMVRNPLDHEIDDWIQRNGHITTKGRRALRRAQFALPPGPVEKRRGIQGRLPIDTIRRARNALARASMMHNAGDLSARELAHVQRAVHQTWPSIHVSPR